MKKIRSLGLPLLAALGLFSAAAVAGAVALAVSDPTPSGFLIGFALWAFVSGIAAVVVTQVRDRRRAFARDTSLGQRIVKEQSRSTFYLKRVDEAIRTAPHAMGKIGVLGSARPPQASADVTTVPALLQPGNASAKRSQVQPVVERERRPVPPERLEAWLDSRRGGAALEPVVYDWPAHRTGKVPFASDVSVAMIADDFTFNSFRHDLKVTRLDPSRWRAQMDEAQPQLFFCESAWVGGDPAKRPWQGKIYKSSRFSAENRTEILGILDYCRKHSIPTVFWNKEDPTHYGDRINDFVSTAFLFDYIYTTAEECVPSYKRDILARKVDVLPFAAQPQLFNPIGRQDASDNAVFAGTWYQMYPKRCKVAAQMMDLVLDTGRDLVIYDRMFANPSVNYRFPERFQDFIRPAIPYVQTADAFRESKFGITLNTVTDSATMFARRAFELAASGTVVLSNHSEGVVNFFGDAVIYADRNPEHLRDMTEVDYRRLQRAGLRVALSHTYTHRAEQILTDVGIPFQSKFGPVAALARVRTEEDAHRLMQAVHVRNDFNSLVAVVASDAEDALQMRLMRQHDPHMVVISAEELSRGDYQPWSLLTDRGVIVADDHGTLPSESDVDELLLHETYALGPIRMAWDDAVRFTHTPVTSLSGVYVPATHLTQVFRDRSNATVLNI